MSVTTFRWLLVYFWIAIGFQQVAAQQQPVSFEFRHIQEKDGLSFNLINCFLRDQDGFLWIGTYDGLNRYDGNHFITFKHQRANTNGLLDNAVQDICEDHTGMIWMAV